MEAQVFALGCASSMATLPVTMKCVDATKEVSQTVSRFVLSLGATVNMDGSALYFPVAIVFMAEAAGLVIRVRVRDRGGGISQPPSIIYPSSVTTSTHHILPVSFLRIDTR